MSLTLTKASATPSSLKYTFVGTGTDTAQRTITQILSDAAAGPLKNLLSQVSRGLNAGVSGLTWETLANSGLLSIYTSMQDTSGTASGDLNVHLTGISPDCVLEALCAFGANNVSGIIELRFVPSQVR